MKRDAVLLRISISFIQLCLMALFGIGMQVSWAVEPEYSLKEYFHTLTGDTQSWKLSAGKANEYYEGSRGIGLMKIAKALPFVQWIAIGDNDGPKRLLIAHAKMPDQYQRVVFEVTDPSQGAAMLMFQPIATRADWEWEKNIAPTWVVDPPDGADFKRQRKYDIVANSGFNGWREVHMEFFRRNKGLPSIVDATIEMRDHRADQMKDPDIFGSKFNGNNSVTVEKIAGQRVFRWTEEGFGTNVTWPSQGRMVECAGSGDIMNEVVAVILSKHPSDLPLDYKHFSPKIALVHELERQIPLLTAAINEPPRELCDRYKPWAWVIGLGHLKLDCRPTMTDKDGKDWQDFIMPTADEYEKVQVDLWEQFVWGPKPAEPIIDLDGYTKAVLAWRKNVIDVRLPKILKRLKAGDVKYDSKLRYWRFDD